MLKSVSILLASVALTACMATHPERMQVITPENPNVYGKLSCVDIDTRLSVLEPQMDEKYGILRHRAEADQIQASTIVFFPPMALTLESVDGPEALHYRTMRGTESTLHQEWRKKGCPDEGLTTAQIYQMALDEPKPVADTSTDEMYRAVLKAAE